MDRPRLLVLASTFPVRPDDGTPAFVRDLALAEAEAFDTVVLVPAVAGAPARERVGAVQIVRFRYFFRRWEDLADGAIMENLRARPSRYLQVLPLLVCEHLAIRRVARRHRPQVLHVHWIVPQGLAALFLMRRTPAVLTCHGGDLYGLRDRISRRIKRAVLSRAAVVTTVNADMRRRVIDLGVAPSKALVLSMGADADGILAAGSGIARIPGRLLFVGRLVEKKGLTYVLAALRRVAEEPSVAPGWSLVVAGDGPLRMPLESAAAGLPVEFRGQVGRAALGAEFARTEIVVVPSVPGTSGDQDGLPVALLEAMSTGCAVVASDLPGLNEVIEDGVSGVLVPAGDTDALANAIVMLLADPERRASLGSGAAQVAAGFTTTAVGGRYRALLTEIAVSDHH